MFMHVFTATITAGPAGPEQTVQVRCGYWPAAAGYYVCVNGRRDTLRLGLTLAGLLHWLRGQGINWPGGLLTALRRDAQGGTAAPGRLVCWREQGPEVLGLLPAA